MDWVEGVRGTALLKGIGKPIAWTAAARIGREGTT
jgi:hypothetical protein